MYKKFVSNYQKSYFIIYTEMLNFVKNVIKMSLRAYEMNKNYNE